MDACGEARWGFVTEPSHLRMPELVSKNIGCCLALPIDSKFWYKYLPGIMWDVLKLIVSGTLKFRFNWIPVFFLSL